MTAAEIVVAAALGLTVGSFLNVVAYRVPRKLSIVRPRSACPACSATIAAWDNVPLVSWLVLRGRCRSCKAPIPWRYPAVEALTAACFVGVTLRLGLVAALPAYLVFAAAMVVVAAIDVEHSIIPRRVVYATLAIGAPLLVIASAAGHVGWPLAWAAIGGAGAFLALFAVHLVQPAGMGFGDVRLAGLIGAFLGWLGLWRVATGLFLGFLLGAVVGIALMVAGRAGRRTRIPFGPFLAAGAMASVLWGQALSGWWVR